MVISVVKNDWIPSVAILFEKESPRLFQPIEEGLIRYKVRLKANCFVAFILIESDDDLVGFILATANDKLWVHVNLLKVQVL